MFKIDFKKIIMNLWSVKAGLAGIVLVAVISIGLAGYFYYRLQTLNQDPAEVQALELKQVMTAVGKLIVLPQGEEPTLATVTDPAKLSDQPFFASAKVGYKVLIYTNAKKAILYDPFNDKIAEVAPINIGNNITPVPKAEPEPAVPDKSQIAVKVLNGSGVPGLALKVSGLLKQQGYALVSIGDAPAKSETTTIIYGPGYGAHASAINQIIKNQAVAQEQGSGQEITLTLGSNFVLE